ncbi:MAG: peptide MFS transporter, partial [Ferruginibacter sp.]|nr:peptide MFS transporter [Ferruginibacter sp.]
MKQDCTLEEIQNFKGKYPKQLWYLFFVEMWERFTFYGMRALLTLYISHLILSTNYQSLNASDLEIKKESYQQLNKEVLDTNHPKYYIETSIQSEKDNAEVISNRKYGLIQAFIYAMAFLGGLFADKIFGFRKSVFWGGMLMAVGAFVMAVPGAFFFYAGISILIVGNGFFKPNISTMVGSLYRNDDPRRDAGFSLFYSGINLGALLSGLIIGYIGTSISWSLGFALSGLFMLLGLGLFLKTQKTLGPIGLPPSAALLYGKTKYGLTRNTLVYIASLLFIPLFFILIYFSFEVDVTFLFGHPTDKNGHLILDKNGFPVPTVMDFSDVFMSVMAIVIVIYLVYMLFSLKKDEIGKMIVAIVLIMMSVIFWSFFEQGGGSLNFFAINNVDGLGFNMTQINNAIGAFWVVLLAPLIGIFWFWLSKRKLEPNTTVKFGLGFIFLGAGFLIFFWSKFFSTPDGLTPLWTFILAYLVITIGELCLSPIGLSMITRLSPARLTGMMMGTWFLASAYGQYGAGLIGAALARGKGKVLE